MALAAVAVAVRDQTLETHELVAVAVVAEDQEIKAVAAGPEQPGPLE